MYVLCVHPVRSLKNWEQRTKLKTGWSSPSTVAQNQITVDIMWPHPLPDRFMLILHKTDLLVDSKWFERCHFPDISRNSGLKSISIFQTYASNLYCFFRQNDIGTNTKYTSEEECVHSTWFEFWILIPTLN